MGASSATPDNTVYGEGTGIIWLDEVLCQGDERNIGLCSHNEWGANDCNHGEDTSVICVNGTEDGIPPGEWK